MALNGQTLWNLEMTSNSDWIIKAAVSEKAIDVGSGSLAMYGTQKLHMASLLNNKYCCLIPLYSLLQ